MISKIQIKKYRKLKNIELDLGSGINVISGTNGTCKSSILYLISNAFQEVKSGAEWLKEKSVVNVIKSINNGVNLKIESLTKGDDKYNDPAPDNKGTLFTCLYEDGINLEFRRHNTRVGTGNRFALKPAYKRGCEETLPSLPVLYLGLSRLYSFGEYNNDGELKHIRKSLPIEYLDIVRKHYKDFTGIEIQDEKMQLMGEIKKRAKFLSNIAGIDSNTISAGEDNLLIILMALVSLRYYFENIESHRNTESILLVDEVDATLHPAYQINLLDLFKDYSEKYRIKIVFTTHSISMLEYAFALKCNVIYLLDDIDSVRFMQDVDIYKIKMFLHNQVRDEIYLNRAIPIFTEDEEARCFLNALFEYYIDKYKDDFCRARVLFHLVDANISGDALVNIFNDDLLLRSTMRSICVLDGDKHAQQNVGKCTITLPGKKAPEQVVFDYAIELYNRNDKFWENKTVRDDFGYTKIRFRDVILPDILNIEKKIEELKSQEKSVKGVKRAENKRVFNKHKQFFLFVIKKWIIDHEEETEIFYKQLHTLFCKVSEFHDISTSEWKCGKK